MDRKEGREGRRRVGREGGRETKEGKRQHSSLRVIIKRRKKRNSADHKNRKKGKVLRRYEVPAHTLSLTSL